MVVNCVNHCGPPAQPASTALPASARVAAVTSPEYRFDLPRRRAQDGVHMPQSQSSGRYDQHPEYHGRFAGIDARPRPFQQPIPLVAGGHSAPAYRRAVARAHG